MLTSSEKQNQTQYSITSLTPEKATAEALLKLRREHWTIENKLHWVRDTVLTYRGCADTFGLYYNRRAVKARLSTEVY